MKILFLGTHTFATTILHALTQESTFEICAVVTRPDKPAGRGYKTEPPLMKRFAEQAGLSILQYKKLNDEAAATLRAYNADIFIVAEYGILIPETVLSIPSHGVLNVHPSLLPKYRGASPIQSALLNGDAETGVSIMLLDAEMDHGPILAQERCAVDTQDTAPTLEAKLGRLGAQLLINTLPDWIVHNIQPREQNHAQATFCKKLTRDDGRIDWSKSAEEIHRMWRAYLPWPGVFTMWNWKRVKIVNCHPERSEGSRQVTVMSRDPSVASLLQDDSGPGTPFLTPKKQLAISCGAGAIIVERLQLEGKKELNADAFLRGYPAFLNAQLS